MDQAEKLRNVIKLKNQKLPQKARVITVTSGKGGVGKSSVTVNLAIQFQKMNKKVIIFDADLGLANVEVMLGAIPKHNLSDVIYRGMDIRQIITEGPAGVSFISGGSGIVGMNNLSKDQITFLVRNLAQLDEMADIVLEFVMACPEVLLVSTPEPSSLTDSYSLLKALHRNPNFAKSGTQIHVVANRVNSVEDGQAVYDKLNTVVSQFLNGNLEYLGMIPQDSMFEKAIRQQQIVSLYAPETKSAKAFEILANNLIEGAHDIPLMKRGFAQLFAEFFNNR